MIGLFFELIHFAGPPIIIIIYSDLTWQCEESQAD